MKEEGKQPPSETKPTVNNTKETFIYRIRNQASGRLATNREEGRVPSQLPGPSCPWSRPHRRHALAYLCGTRRPNPSCLKPQQLGDGLLLSLSEETNNTATGQNPSGATQESGLLQLWSSSSNSRGCKLSFYRSPWGRTGDPSRRCRAVRLRISPVNTESGRPQGGHQPDSSQRRP